MERLERLERLYRGYTRVRAPVNGNAPIVRDPADNVSQINQKEGEA
jgi:hypothetical protein